MLVFILFAFTFTVLVASLYMHFERSKSRLPPGPPPLPLLGNLLSLSDFSSLEPVLRRLRATYGPIVTFHVGPRPAIFIMDAALAHQCFVQRSGVFAHRPTPIGTSRALSVNLNSINMAPYGPLWRLIRRRLAEETFNVSRHTNHKETNGARQWALDALLRQLTDEARDNGGVVAAGDCFKIGLFRYASLLCLGVKMEDELLREVRQVQLDLVHLVVKLTAFDLLPKIFLLAYLTRWKKIVKLRAKQDKLILPLIESSRLNQGELRSYTDELLELRHVEQGGRALNVDETVSLCSEFMNALAEPISTSLEWIMARLVKHQHIQEKLYDEIQSTSLCNSIDFRDQEKMPYLRAVVLEGLRLHPPPHFLVPHKVSEDVELGKYVIPKGCTINCTVAEIGRDCRVWSEAMEFKPERFLEGGEGEGVDLVGSKEIKMMPFGVGRRICPGFELAPLLLQYFVGNLVKRFKWVDVDGEEVDLSEEAGLIFPMRTSLRARVVSR